MTTRPATADKNMPKKLVAELAQEYQHEQARRALAYPRLVEALRKCRNGYWDALGGNDDADNRERAVRLCKPFDKVIARIEVGAGEAITEIEHRTNAYPRLVEILKYYATRDVNYEAAHHLLQDLGEI